MATATGAKPHPIFLAGRWVESPDRLVVDNPSNPAEPAGSTFNATPEQYDEAVAAAVVAFETTRVLPAYERGSRSTARSSPSASAPRRPSGFTARSSRWT